MPRPLISWLLFFFLLELWSEVGGLTADIGARLGLRPPCKLYLLGAGKVLDCPGSELALRTGGPPCRLHLIALSGLGLTKSFIDLGSVEGPSPETKIKDVPQVRNLSSLPHASVYWSPSGCVASVLTGRAVTYFFKDEINNFQVKPVCNGSFPITGQSENDGLWFKTEVVEDTVPGGVQAELTDLEGIIIEEDGSEPIELPEVGLSEDVEVRLLRQPHLGTLTVDGHALQVFTAGQALQGKVVYESLGGWGSDHLVLQIWGLRFIYPIYVIPANQRNRRSGRSVSNGGKQTQKQNRIYTDIEDVKDRRQLHLDESGLMELTNNTLRIPGKPSDKLKVEYSPKHGRILLRGEPALKFSLADISAQVVIYEHDGKETGHTVLKDKFVLKLISEKNEILFEVDVYIHPIDDTAPKIWLEGDLKVKEGGRGKLSTRQIKVEDPDTIDKDITCHIIAQPLFGQVRVSERPSTFFDYSQLKNGLVSYVQTVHLGLEPREDGLSVACYDAENNTESGNNFGIISINIEGVNDEAPTINPKVIHVRNGGEVALSPELIASKDLDTPLEKLTFLLEIPPSKGVIMKKISLSEYQGVKNFSHADMKDVYYRSGTDIGEDGFTLSVSDGTNESKAHVKVVIKKNQSPPQLLINEGLELEEGALVQITSKILFAEGGDTPPEKIVYILRDTPLFGTLMLDGVELTPGARFSQMGIDSSRIAYHHTDPSSSMDVFVFDLTDGRNTLFNQNFFITIHSHNQSYPIVTSETAIIPPMTNLTITPRILKVKNADSVEFHVMSPPRYGKLQIRGKSEPVHSFTYNDIEEEQIQYAHLKNSSLPEIIQFEVSDGRNSIFHTLNINFTSEDMHILMSAEALVSEELTEETITSRPIIINNNPIRSLRKFDDGTIGTFITKKNLYAEDEGRNITYVIADPPKYGHLLNQRTNNTCGNFTQDDLNLGRLMYILKPGVKVPGDAVLLNIIGQGLPLKGLQLILEWSWVHFKTNFTIVDESVNLLKIQLTRWGSLAESSFVGVIVEGGNATSMDDYVMVQDQVQFSPGESVAYLNIQINDDLVFEDRESILISLKEPYSLLIDEPSSISVVIDDTNDVPKYVFKREKYEVYENMPEIILPVLRFGDLTKDIRLECFTENGEAEGGTNLDFMPQPGVPSPVKFSPGDNEAFCTVSITNDNVMEPKEDFWVILKNRQREMSRTHIAILPDEEDFPEISFISESLSVSENDGELIAHLIVRGSREIVNSSVTVTATGISAKANKDFVFKKQTILIFPDKDKYEVRVQIVDDNEAKMYEGNEKFLLSLVEPKNCTIGPKNNLTVTIEDESDVAIIQFLKDNYTISEQLGKLEIEVERQGDMVSDLNVICYAHEKSATFSDFSISVNETYQLIHFLPGEMKKNCTVIIKDDNLFETEEHFTVHLKPEDTKVKIGHRSQVTVTIIDEEDKEIIFFRKTHYFVKEPQSVKQNGTVKIQVSREGDTKYSTDVRIYTKDGTAKSGEDYIGKTAVMAFEPGQRTFTCEIQILYDKEIEVKEYFTIHFEVLNKGETIYSRRSIIYIYDSPHPGGMMFPVSPLVLSLNDLEGPPNEGHDVIQGYPLVCLSVCNRQHYLFKKFDHWCSKHDIHDSSTKYTWQIEDKNGKTIDVPFPLFLANTSWISLESVYIRGGFKLRCGVTPVSETIQGKTSFSEYVSISRAPGACPPPSENMIGAEPFIAQISFADDPKERAKLIKLSVAIPHYDGLFPAISTHPLGDAFQILNSYTPRPEVHKCSNIITNSELQTKYGFLNSRWETEGLRRIPSHLQRYRGIDALNLYNHLDLESCVWNFEAYYTLDELVNYCGATVDSESNLYDTERTSVTLELPLFVSYYTYSVFGWQHTDTSIVLRLTFLYEGSVLSDEGVVKQDHDNLEGILHPTSMHISSNGSLVVYFRTTPRFPGYFLLHNNEGFQSYVHSLEHPEMPITLKLMNNKTSTSEAEQYWLFFSDFSNDDYTGRYEVSLVPCMFIDSAEICTPRQNIIFPLDIHLQQMSDPVLKKYTLNTSFHLVKKRETKDSVEESSMFEPGDHVYGFISMEPPQSHLELIIDQCYVCSGRNGRTPKYNPKKKEYGCLMESPDLEYSVKIIDRHRTTGSVEKSHHEMKFNATIFRKNENDSSITFLDEKNVDIFHFDITPLFSLKSSKVWFVHCTFTIKSLLSERLSKRSIFEEATKKVSQRKGTNMHRLVLQEAPQPKASKNLRPMSSVISKSENHSSRIHIASEDFHMLWLLSVLIVLFVSMILTIILLCYIVHVKRELSSKKNANYNNVNYRECLTNDFNY